MRRFLVGENGSLVVASPPLKCYWRKLAPWVQHNVKRVN